MNILAIAGSNSKQSINKQLAKYAASKFQEAEVSLYDMNDFDLPLYSPELEQKEDVPPDAQRFLKLVSDADLIILSLAEYNGFHATAFKNLWDWASRIEQKMWANKPMLLMAASPGLRGGMNVLRVTKEVFPHFGGNIVADFSMPNFYENFTDGKITNEELDRQLDQAVSQFKLGNNQGEE